MSVDQSVKALLFSLIPPLNVFGGGGWFLGQHGRLGVHAKRIAWTQTILAIICILWVSWVAFAISQGPEHEFSREDTEQGKQRRVQIASLVSAPFVTAIGILAVANIIIAAVSFQHVKS